MTEHDKYAKGATKPGGYAAQGFYGGHEAAKAAAEKQQQVRLAAACDARLLWQLNVTSALVPCHHSSTC